MGIAAGSQPPWVAEDLSKPTKLFKTVCCGFHLFCRISEEKKMPLLSPWYFYVLMDGQQFSQKGILCIHKM